MAHTIDEIRKDIDTIDAQLLQLLNQRMHHVKAIGELKKSTKTAVYRPEREKAIVDRLEGMSEGLLNRGAIEAIFLEIFAVSRNIELPERVAYLGPRGSFTHQAAEQRFGAMSDYSSLDSIRSVFEAIVTERARFGVIPIENNQEGIVGETIAQMALSDIKIVAEIPMPIHFAFATKEEKLSNIQKIYSKDIAFKQCRKFLEAHFGLRNISYIPVDSTSKAVKIACEEEGSAAICSHIAAKLYNFPILFSNIEDSEDNYTRFLVISREFVNQPSGKDKTTIIATPENSNRPGTLAEFLNDFNDAGINLTKIESYPAKRGKGFKYWFYIEYEGHYQDKSVTPIMKKHEEDIKWMGSYVKLC